MKKIAVLGPKQTYSERAALQYQKTDRHSIIYKDTVLDVIQSVSADTIGIIPIENTLEGYVQPHLDYILKRDELWITGELRLQVSFSLISHVEPKSIETLYVQYAAKNQCLNFIHTLKGVDVIITDSNIAAFERYEKDPFSAAVVPSHIHEKVTSTYSIDDITDELQNETRFYVLEAQKNNQFNQTHYKMAIVFTPTEDKPGLLLSIIEAFANASINLISIMSRPTKKEMGTYHFFIELECTNLEIEGIETILERLSKTMTLRLLGVFPEV